MGLEYGELRVPDNDTLWGCNDWDIGQLFDMAEGDSVLGIGLNIEKLTEENVTQELLVLFDARQLGEIAINIMAMSKHNRELGKFFLSTLPGFMRWLADEQEGNG